MSNRSGSLKVDVAPDYDTMSRRAAELVLGEIIRKPDLLLCASAGGTPVGLYTRLARGNALSPGCLNLLRVIQIDEWLGIPPAHRASCRSDLQACLIGPAGIPRARFLGFNGAAKAPAGECRRMQCRLRRAGPIDVCILGLGTNGHVAMNEPSRHIEPGVHVAKLARASQKHPLLAAAARKPTHGLTLGLGDILQARKVLLLVSGQHKRAALRRLLEGPVTPLFPASLLRLHGDATVFCDARAAGTPHGRA